MEYLDYILADFQYWRKFRKGIWHLNEDLETNFRFWERHTKQKDDTSKNFKRLKTELYK